MSAVNLTKKVLTLPSLVVFIGVFVTLWSGVPILMIFGAVAYVLWFLVLNRLLIKKLPSASRKEKIANTIYDIILLYAISYLLLSYLISILHISDHHGSLTVIAVVGFVYVYAVISRNLIVVEKHIFDGDTKFLGTFLSFYFLPIGIFFLQPRIRKCLLHELPLDS